MLLDLPQDIINFIHNRQLKPSTAEELFPPVQFPELAMVIVNKQLSSRCTKSQSDNYYCPQISDSIYNYGYHVHHNKYYDDIRAVDRSLHKSILALRIAMSRIGGII